jgi:hypothetical protein
MEIDVDNVHIKASFPDVVVDCLGERRHFTIRGTNVTIEGLMLVNGSSETDKCLGGHLSCPITLDGGCLLIHGNHTVIRNSTFVNCWASEHGGAISESKSNATVILEAVSIQHSTATRGGGVWSRGLLTLNNCTFSFNHARLHGGALFKVLMHSY